VASYSKMPAGADGSEAADRRVFVDVPVLCGHRGSGSGVVAGQRENTLGSYRAAVAAGLRWVEVDVRLTADAVLVARHDPVVDDGRFIADLTAAETDEVGVMRVADLLEELPPEVAVDVDVKTSLEDALRSRAATTAAVVAELAVAERRRRRLLVTSFDPAALLIVRELAPALPTGLLTWTRFPLRKAIPAAVHLGADVVVSHVESFALDETAVPRLEREAARSVAVAHAAGLQVGAWCPRRAQAEQLVAAGVDCLVVDGIGAGQKAIRPPVR
jgi:glycerophosphoryl diester phosphodiesterase